MPPRCNKCKQGLAQEGDTWCLRCSSLEHSLGLLRQGWRNQGLRAVAEEALLSSARLCRAFSNLDHSLATTGAGQESRAPAATAKSREGRPRGSRSPRRDTRPAIPRSPARAATAERGAAPPPESEESDSDEEEEEEERVEAPITEVKREDWGSDKPPEPEGPPPPRPHSSRTERRPRDHQGEEKPRKRHSGRDSGHKKRRRGGTKHQRRHKDIQDPLRRSHRKLRADQVTLSPSFEEGLARRY